MAEPVIVKERPGGLYTNDVITTRGHHLYADDLGPSPFEYLSAALGACTNMTLRMYIGRKKWSVDRVSVEVIHKKVSRGDEPPRDVFTRIITIEGDIDRVQRARLLEIANKCPVHKTLEAGSEVITKEKETAPT